jgi:hypothetical protein
VPDYSQPGSDGVLPAGVNEWLRGLVYTAKPEIPSPLRRGQEYRITAAFKEKVGNIEEFAGYGKIYQRVTAIAKARIAQLTCANEQQSLHTWIACHGWRSLGETSNIATAFLTMGLLCPENRDAKLPGGESVPTAAALMRPDGATMEMLTRFSPQRVDELYKAFDFSDPSGVSTDPVTVSYGERVPSSESVDFRPFVQRAEKMARFYYEELERRPGSGPCPLQILRREWYCVTDANLVVVQVYFHGDRPASGREIICDTMPKEQP